MQVASMILRFPVPHFVCNDPSELKIGPPRPSMKMDQNLLQDSNTLDRSE
jgi:hypothetical protein